MEEEIFSCEPVSEGLLAGSLTGQQQGLGFILYIPSKHRGMPFMKEFIVQNCDVTSLGGIVSLFKAWFVPKSG